MKTLATIFLAASMATGSLVAVSTSAEAAPIANVEIAHSTDIVTIRDERDWRHHRYERGDRRNWHRGRDDWRRDRWRHDRYWGRDRDWRHDRYRHHRSGVVIRF